METVFNMMRLMCRLVDRKRTGWNLEFPPGHQCTTRKVEYPESTAAHMYTGMVLLWMLGLNDSIEIFMAHDMVESVAKDHAVITEIGLRRELAEAAKKEDELRAIEVIRFIGGAELGEKIAQLYFEFEENKTPRAKNANEVDKLDACLKAVYYCANGEQVNPWEFIANGVQCTTNPQLRKFLELIEQEGRRLRPSIQEMEGEECEQLCLSFASHALASGSYSSHLSQQ